MPSIRSVTETAPGTFLVDVGGRQEIVFVSGPPEDRWAFWNGQIFHLETADRAAGARSNGRAAATVALTAPMPATVVRILVEPGAKVTKGDTVVVLEAMKMELPVRAASDGTVESVTCSEGELVGADQTLVTMK